MTDDQGGLPIKLDETSNGELPPTSVDPDLARAKDLAAARLTEFARRTGVKRRAFLAGLCGAATTLLAPRAATSRREDTTVLKRDLSLFLADVFDPRDIGEEFLAAHPGRIDATHLLAALDETPAPARAGGRVSRWRRRRRREFEREDVVVVNGWVMARAEAEACALLSML